MCCDRRLGSLMILLAGLLLVGGCAADGLPDAEVERLASLTYPEQAERGPALDVVVKRTNGSIRLTNRTAQAHEGMRLWLNRQYVGEIDRLGVGESTRIGLDAFVNRYGEPFPTGMLLAPETERPVLSAQLHDPEAGVLYPLVVFPEGE